MDLRFTADKLAFRDELRTFSAITSQATSAARQSEGRPPRYDLLRVCPREPGRVSGRNVKVLLSRVSLIP